MEQKKITILTIAALVLVVWAVYGADLPKWFPFNTKNALNEWQEKVFKNKVIYVVEPQKENGYLSATSDKACSGLLYKIKFYPQDTPMISWKWKILQFPASSTAAKTNAETAWVEKDDYAARLYVIFPSWNFMNIQTLEYVWDETAGIGEIKTSPYFKNIKLIVAESGKEKLGEWVQEERNIYEDYSKAFGRPPRGYVGAIALMTDADNTVSSAEALYTDIKVGYKK